MVKLRENEAYSKFVEQQLNRKQQKCASLQKQYEELTASFKIDEIELAICDLQSSVDKLKDDFDQIKLVKEKLTEMVCKSNLILTNLLLIYSITSTRKN